MSDGRELILKAPLGMDTEFEPSEIRRFMDKVKRDSDCGCWVWQGHCDDKGYGQFRFRHRAYWAHRIAFAMFRRPLIPSLTVEHKCRNPSCVNPWHLELLTNLENVTRQHTHTHTHTILRCRFEDRRLTSPRPQARSGYVRRDVRRTERFRSLANCWPVGAES